MNRRLFLAIFLAFTLASTGLNMSPVGATYVPSPVTVNITPSGANSDGYVSLLTGTYTKVDGSGGHLYNYYAGSGTAYNGWSDFDTTIIPTNATVTSVILHVAFQTYGNTAKKITSLPASGSSLAASTLYNDIVAGSVYYTSATGLTTNTYYAWDLGASAVTTLQTQLAAHWFSVGYYTAVVSTTTDYYPRTSGTYYEYLSITYNIAPTAYHYTLNSSNEDGTAAVVTVTETDPSGSSTLSVTGTPAVFYFTVQPTVFTWTVTGGYPRQIYPTGPTGTYLITQAESTTTLFNIQFKDLANVFASGAATLRISKIVSGSSAIITEFPVPDTISSNPAALIPNTAYTVDLIDHNGVTHALGNYIPLISAQTPTFLLAQTPFAGLIQFVVPNLQYSCARITPYTTITVDYVNTLTAYTTPWARVDWKYRNGTIAHSLTSSGEAITFTWTGATPAIDYVVTLRVYHTFFGNVTKSFISTGIPFNPAAPISLVGLGNWGGVAASAVVGIIVLLLFAGMGSSMKPGSAAVMLCIVGAILAYEGWLIITASVLAIALTFAVIMAMNEERRT